MNAYYSIFLLAFVILVAILLLRYINDAVDREFQNLDRAAFDPDFRREEIARLDRLLASRGPLPDSAGPLPRPSSSLVGGLPPILLILGVILLLGGGAAQRDRANWFYGGIAALGVAAVIMLVSIARRRWARTARQLLYRADLKRVGGDRAGAARDLQVLLRLTPWDDSAWAELSDDLASEGKLPDALAAISHAAELDPGYDEYRMITASLAIRARRLDVARDAIAKWTALDGVRTDDPRLGVYQAALRLALGHPDEATAFLKRALAGHSGGSLGFLEVDSALAEVRDLLPGGGADFGEDLAEKEAEQVREEEEPRATAINTVAADYEAEAALAENDAAEAVHAAAHAAVPETVHAADHEADDDGLYLETESEAEKFLEAQEEQTAREERKAREDQVERLEREVPEDRGDQNALDNGERSG